MKSVRALVSALLASSLLTLGSIITAWHKACSLDSGSLEDPLEAIGRLVLLRLSDVYYPGREEMLENLSLDMLVRGRVVSLSDGEGKRQTYAVIDIEGMTQDVVAPVSKLRFSGS